MADCVRQAWLVWGTLTLPLEDASAGYFCTQLDLGYPAIREVVNNKPDQQGVDDRTQYFGARTVSADITALAGAGAQIDAVVEAFAPFMVPTARPVLHYILDRPGVAERVMTLRPSGFSGPIAGPFQRDIQLQWVCADPDAKDPNVRTAQAFAGSTVSPGRVYNRTYPLVYPVGGNSPTTGYIEPHGDLAVRPKLFLYGPITAAVITVSIAGGSTYYLRFQPYFTIGAGQYVEIDCYNKTVRLNGDPNQNMATMLDWQNSSWPVVGPVPPNPNGAYLQVAGSSTSSISQVQAQWQDRYIA